MKKHLKKYNKPKILVLGPYPPPVGGVATVLKSLTEQEEIKKKYNINLHMTGAVSETTSFRKQSIKDILSIIRFFITLKFKNVDIFHIHTASYFSFFRNIPYILISKIFSKGKIVLHIHGGKFHIFYDAASKPLKIIIKHVLKSCDTIIVTSKSWIDIIKKISGRHDKIFSISNGFDEKIFYPTITQESRKQTNLPYDKKILLSIGSLEDTKGHIYLLESMKEIIKERDDVICYIIGAGSLEEHIKNTIDKYNLKDHVILAGGDKSLPEIAQWLNSCDIFVLPSINEGNPTVMFECLGCGKPFVGTRVGGIPEIITSEEYGLLCNTKDPNDLTEKILISLKTKWNQNKIIKYAQQFTWTKKTNKLIEIYEFNLK